MSSNTIEKLSNFSDTLSKNENYKYYSKTQVKQLFDYLSANNVNTDEFCKKPINQNKKREREESSLDLETLPKTMEDLVSMWKNKEITTKELEKHLGSHWGYDDDTAIRCGGRKLIDITDEMIEEREDEIQDNGCRIFFNLETFEFMGPYSYMSDEEDKKANEIDKKDHCILIFAK